MFKKLCLTLAAILFATNAYAVTANSIITTQTPKLGVVQFLQGTDTAGTYKTLYTAGASGSQLSGLVATSNDASASHLLTCQIVRSAVFYGGVAITIPVSAGFANATAQVNLMSPVNWIGLPVDGNTNPFLYMNSGDMLECTYATALTATDVINIIAVGSDF